MSWGHTGIRFGSLPRLLRFTENYVPLVESNTAGFDAATEQALRSLEIAVSWASGRSLRVTAIGGMWAGFPNEGTTSRNRQTQRVAVKLTVYSLD